jgi:hypothetical protein
MWANENWAELGLEDHVTSGNALFQRGLILTDDKKYLTEI